MVRNGREARGSDRQSSYPPPHDTVDGQGWNQGSGKNEKACVLCHRRKVRCDKTLPCSTCARLGVLCCYPASEAAALRKPKTTIADIASRLVMLERTVIALSRGSEEADSGGGAAARDSSSVGETSRRAILSKRSSTRRGSAEEILVQHGYASQYINEILLSHILKEVSEFNCFLRGAWADTFRKGRGDPNGIDKSRQSRGRRRPCISIGVDVQPTGSLPLRGTGRAAIGIDLASIQVPGRAAVADVPPEYRSRYQSAAHTNSRDNLLHRHRAAPRRQPMPQRLAFRHLLCGDDQSEPRRGPKHLV